MTHSLPLYLTEILAVLDQAGIARFIIDRHTARLQTVSGSTQFDELALPEDWSTFSPDWQEMVRQTHPEVHWAWNDPYLRVSSGPRHTQLAWQRWLEKPGWTPAMVRHLDHRLALGDNVLWTGWWPACVQLMGALADRGQVVGAWRCGASWCPSHFIPCTSHQQLRDVGAERVISWSGQPRGVVSLMQQQQSVCAWLQGGRVDRLLSRFELACQGLWKRQAQPLDVLTAIDWLVVMAPQQDHLLGVYQVVLHEQGYQLLCVASEDGLEEKGVGPSAPHGETESAQSLPPPSPRTKLSSSTARTSKVRWHPTAVQALSTPHSLPRPPLQSGSQARGEPGGSGSHGQDIDPGWELERHLVDPQIPASGGLHEQYQEQAASLAATFGLGPPPPPSDATTPGLQSAAEPDIDQLVQGPLREDS